jgi:hypothetical protein
VPQQQECESEWKARLDVVLSTQSVDTHVVCRRRRTSRLRKRRYDGPVDLELNLTSDAGMVPPKALAQPNVTDQSPLGV